MLHFGEPPLQFPKIYPALIFLTSETSALSSPRFQPSSLSFQCQAFSIPYPHLHQNAVNPKLFTCSRNVPEDAPSNVWGWQDGQASKGVYGQASALHMHTVAPAHTPSYTHNNFLKCPCFTHATALLH